MMGRLVKWLTTDESCKWMFNLKLMTMTYQWIRGLKSVGITWAMLPTSHDHWSTDV